MFSRLSVPRVGSAHYTERPLRPTVTLGTYLWMNVSNTESIGTGAVVPSSVLRPPWVRHGNLPLAF